MVDSFAANNSIEIFELNFWLTRFILHAQKWTMWNLEYSILYENLIAYHTSIFLCELELCEWHKTSVFIKYLTELQHSCRRSHVDFFFVNNFKKNCFFFSIKQIDYTWMGSMSFHFVWLYMLLCSVCDRVLV